MSRKTRSDDWGFPRWRGYGSSREAVKVRLCDRFGCTNPGDRPAPKAPNSPERWWFCLHNFLDPIQFTPDSPWYTPWAMIHDRSVIDIGSGMAVKTSYPVLPWIGLILLGYACGPWFARGSDPAPRIRRLIVVGLALIVGFILIRYLNFYGDKPWFQGETPLRSVMSFLALTKYPPSLLFPQASSSIR